MRAASVAGISSNAGGVKLGTHTGTAAVAHARAFGLLAPSAATRPDSASRLTARGTRYGEITLTGRRLLTLPGSRLADEDRGTEGLIAMVAHVSWHEAAACQDCDPDVFFPDGRAGFALRQVEEAKEICRACPVQAPCLAWAQDHAVGFGVWGGTTEVERRALRQSAQRNHHHPRPQRRRRRSSLRWHPSPLR